MPKFKVDVALSTNPDDKQTNNFGRLQEDPMVIGNAGEYEVQGVFVYGRQATDGSVIYALEAEGMHIAHLGTTPRELTEKELELFEGVDVLFLPITGDKKVISTLISHIEPRVIIPIQYKTPKLKLDLNPLEDFLKEVGAKSTEPEPKVILKEKQLPSEETQVIVLNVA